MHRVRKSLRRRAVSEENLGAGAEGLVERVVPDKTFDEKHVAAKAATDRDNVQSIYLNVG